MIDKIFESFIAIATDILPIVTIIFSFQFLILRQPMLHMRQIIIGLAMLWAGLSLFLVGLNIALFPIGSLMAEQLIQAQVVPSPEHASKWYDYYWVYLFALSMGAAAAMAEPSLIAVAERAHEVSSGRVRPLTLRIAVAAGVALGMILGCWRIVTGFSLTLLVLGLYLILLLQTRHSPRFIVPVAYDLGGVTTSTITIPVIASLGLGLASAIPGRDPLIDGFGLIVLSCMMPAITVMGYAQLAVYQAERSRTTR